VSVSESFGIEVALKKGFFKEEFLVITSNLIC